MRLLSACIACRDRRKRCHRARPGISCEFCIQRNIDCVIDRVTNKAASPTHGYQSLKSHADDRGRNFSHLILPDATLSESLVELYFRHIHIAFHNIFHRPTIISQVRSGSIPKILFFGMVSLSARYSDHPTLATIPPWDRGRPYRDEAKRLLDLHDASLTTIQACMLLSGYASAEGESVTESVYHATASRMAVILDLPTLPTSSAVEQELNRRVWWSLIAMDTWTSAALSLPRSIKPRDTVPLPIDEQSFADLGMQDDPPDKASMNAESPFPDRSDSVVAHLVRVNGLLYDIFRLNATIVAEQTSEESVEEEVQRLTENLNSWLANLPDRFMWSAHNLAQWTSEGRGPMFTIMHLNYNHAGQLLYYHALRFNQEFQGDSSVSRASEVFAQRCKTHAASVCEITRLAAQQHETTMTYPLAGHVVCLSSTVHIHTLLFGVDPEEAETAKRCLESNFGIITAMHQYWPIANIILGRLQAFHNACLQSQDDSFELNHWMLRFMLEFEQPIEERAAADATGEAASKSVDALKRFLDI